MWMYKVFVIFRGQFLKDFFVFKMLVIRANLKFSRSLKRFQIIIVIIWELWFVQLREYIAVKQNLQNVCEKGRVIIGVSAFKCVTGVSYC